ncbi:hypothetical protein [Niabella digestorum]|uniref:Uncharacterized protein n=1 Tax=Niabella digestorum TaxID=3117701 RepID=A0ABU7RJ66_9BACT
MLKMTKSAYTIQLSPTRITKLDALFQIPLDKDGGYIAAFIPDNPSDKTLIWPSIQNYLTPLLSTSIPFGLAIR